jgi:hypothetical protein
VGALFALVCVDSGDLLLTHKSAGDGVFSVTVLRVVLIEAGDRAGFLEYRHFDGGSLLSDIATARCRKRHMSISAVCGACLFMVITRSSTRTTLGCPWKKDAGVGA